LFEVPNGEGRYAAGLIEAVKVWSNATASKISQQLLMFFSCGHGITPRTVATWYPYLMRTPRVLVPMELNVLMVRDANQSWAALA